MLRITRPSPLALLVSARAISVFGDMLVPIAMTFAVLDSGGSASAVGLVLGARFIPMILLIGIGGVVADRHPRRTVMIVASLAGGFLQVATAITILWGEPAVWLLATLSLLKGGTTAFFLPASNAMVADVVPADDIQRAYGLAGTAGAASDLLGPVCAGVIVALSNPGWALLLDGATFAISAGLLLCVPATTPREPAARAGMLTELREGWREVRSRQWLWIVIACSTGFQFVVLASIAVLGPLVARESLGGAAAWATVVTAFGAGGLVGGLVSARINARYPLRLAFQLILLAGPPSLTLLAIPAPLPWVAIAELVSGFAVGAFGTFESTAIAEAVPRSALSRVSAYNWMGSMALRPLGLVCVGPLADAIGVRTTLFAAAAVALWSCLSPWPAAASATSAPLPSPEPSLESRRRLFEGPRTPSTTCRCRGGTGCRVCGTGRCKTGLRSGLPCAARYRSRSVSPDLHRRTTDVLWRGHGHGIVSRPPQSRDRDRVWNPATSGTGSTSSRRRL